MTAYIIYTDGKNYIDKLCVGNIDLVKCNILIPHIGETFIDKVNDVEYEVKDIIRSINAKDEYGVQVLLKRRTEKKYQ